MFGKNKSTGSIEYIVVGLGNPTENTKTLVTTQAGLQLTALPTSSVVM
jgi:hypothetical protein